KGLIFALIHQTVFIVCFYPDAPAPCVAYRTVNEMAQSNHVAPVTASCYMAVAELAILRMYGEYRAQDIKRRGTSLSIEMQPSKELHYNLILFFGSLSHR